MNLFKAIENADLDYIANALAGEVDLCSFSPEPPKWTLLHEAIEQLEDGGSIEALVLLLRHDIDVNMWDANHDSTPLLMALFRGQLEAVRLLLAAGADPNVVGSEGDSPLRWCVEHGDYDTVAMLLRCGANLTIDSFGGPSGMTALGQAAHRLDLKMIEMLLQAGANPNALDADRFIAARRLPLRSQIEDDTIWLTTEALLADNRVRSQIL